MELDLAGIKARNMTRGTQLDLVPYTPDMLGIIEKGGLMNVLAENLRRREVS